MSLEGTKQIINEDRAVFLNTQQLIGYCPAKVDERTTLPLTQTEAEIQFKNDTQTSDSAKFNMRLIYREAGDGKSRCRINLQLRTRTRRTSERFPEESCGGGETEKGLVGKGRGGREK